MDEDESWSPSEFVYDSPQPSSQLSAFAAPTPSKPHAAAAITISACAISPDDTTAVCTHHTADDPSESSSESSDSAASAARRPHKTTPSSSSSPRDFYAASTLAMDDGSSASAFKMDDLDDAYPFDDATYPMGAGMDNLSLDPMTSTPLGSTFDFGTNQDSPGAFAPGAFADHSTQPYRASNVSSSDQPPHLNISPEMTVTPSKFLLADSREDSPISAQMLTSQESSPAQFMNASSPYSANGDGFSSAFGSSSAFHGLNMQSPNGPAIPSYSKRWIASPSPLPASNTQSTSSQWPFTLTVDKIPEKSRVETQIPIKLWLSPIPDGINKLHLPTHTISKPKLLAKPPYNRGEDTLELSTTLVCASAMRKDNNLQRAYERAATAEGSDPLTNRRNSAGDIQFEDDDPNKPLNGGPVSICQGCITRERKRAARKKNKKADEEEAWAKDEAKRVIVFNTNEVKEWSAPSAPAELASTEGRPGAMYVEAPMRIACYCRHQSEKIGFQVIFTIKTAAGRLVAQAISDSIMITDDHKQPTSQAHNAANAASITTTGAAVAAASGQLSDAGMLSATGTEFGLLPGFAQSREPFKSSWSTNDLQAMMRNFAPQQSQGAMRKSYGTQSTTPSRTTSSTAITPRNLSRPASPTNPQGHSVKKRRSDGPGHAKIPSGLMMTRKNPHSPTVAAAAPANQAPTSAGPINPGFPYGSGAGYGSPMDIMPPASAGLSSQFYHSPQSPMMGNGMSSSTFASPNVEHSAFHFPTAPNSQHPSRAPSPNSLMRMNMTQSGDDAVRQQMLREASNALSGLPLGFNQDRPPAIHQIIPADGPLSGGTEVTILGAGFCKGLEVMFGDTQASQTTFWGDTTMVCRLPPARAPGVVRVTFFHEHPQNPRRHFAPPTPPIHFTYKDEDSNQMLALAGMLAQQGGGGGNVSQEEFNRLMSNYRGGMQGGGFGGGAGAGTGAGTMGGGTHRQATFGAADCAPLMEGSMAPLDPRDLHSQPRTPPPSYDDACAGRDQVVSRGQLVLAKTAAPKRLPSTILGEILSFFEAQLSAGEVLVQKGQGSKAEAIRVRTAKAPVKEQTLCPLIYTKLQSSKCAQMEMICPMAALLSSLLTSFVVLALGRISPTLNLERFQCKPSTYTRAEADQRFAMHAHAL